MKKPSTRRTTATRSVPASVARPVSPRRASPPVAASMAAPEPRHRTRGRELLQAFGEGPAELGRLLGCARGVPHSWLEGRKLPGAAARAQLEELCGVPRAAWNEVPKAAGREPPGRVTSSRVPSDLSVDDSTDLSVYGTTQPGSVIPARAARVLPSMTNNSIDELSELLEAVRVARRDPTLLASERIRAAAEERALLALRARVETQIKIEDRDFEHAVCSLPRWQKLKRELLATLKPFPDAHDAVSALLRRLQLEESST